MDTNTKNHISYQHNHIKIRIPSTPALIVNSGISKYRLDDLDAIMTSLNQTKTKFDSLQYNIIGSIFSKIDMYVPLKSMIEERYNARFVTNAWLKFWEIYSEYDMITKDNSFVFLNAELPGAALEALNQYIRCHKQWTYNWVASSLVSSAEKSALGDSYGLFEHNRSHWLMNLPNEKVKYNNDGDVTNPNNILDFGKKCGPKSSYGGAHLYTHDAGIDPSGDYNNQESMNMFIHLGCAISGFITLRKGGNFIAKQYTLFETLTWNLIILYATLFDEFYLCKPLTSRPANSEIYLIGKGFRGISEDTLDLLMNILKTKNSNPIIDKKYVESIYDTIEPIINFAKIVYTQQHTILEECLQFYKIPNVIHKLSKDLYSLRMARCDNWLKLYPLSSIKDDQVLQSK